MPNPWKKKVLAFNQKRKAESEKASDMDILIGAMLKIAPGQLKKILSDEDVLNVLRKYGYDET